MSVEKKKKKDELQAPSSEAKEDTTGYGKKIYKSNPGNPSSKESKEQKKISFRDTVKTKKKAVPKSSLQKLFMS